MNTSIPKPNVVDFSSYPKQTSDIEEPEKIKRRGLLKRLLISTNFMTTRKGNNEVEQDNWNLGMIAVVVILIVIVITGFLAILFIGGVFYLDMREDWRGTETWRQKQNYDEKRDSLGKCERAVMRQAGLIEIYKKAKLEIPPEFLVVEPCGLPKSENTNTGH